jgi:hypothetical protein
MTYPKYNLIHPGCMNQYITYILNKTRNRDIIISSINFSDFIPNFDAEHDVLIYAGYCKYNEENIITLPSKYLSNFLKKRVKANTNIIFDNSMEGGVDDVIDRIYAALMLVPEINPKNIYYVTGAINSLECYKKFCNVNNIPLDKQINVISVSYWERHMKDTTSCLYPNFNIGIKEKIFLCFNRVMRPHRILLVSKFIQHELLEKSYFSFFPLLSHSHKMRPSMEYTLPVLKYSIPDNPEIYDEVETIMKENESLFPLRLNIDYTFNKNWLDMDDFYLYENSYLSIVTETFFFDNMRDPNSSNNTIRNLYSVFFTEKIFKPIAMKHPFIVFSRPNTLLELHKKGYKSFVPFINEDYDSIEDNITRFNFLLDEIIRLSKLTDQEWIEWQKNIQHIVEHNYDILKTEKDIVVEKNFQ